MKVIPVLDIRSGLVVRARLGDRATYAPIETPLADSPDPTAIVNGFLALHPFDTFYIADLDGIERHRPAHALVESLANRFGDLTFWVDSGIGTADEVLGGPVLPNARKIIASESMSDAVDLAPLRDSALLSLDFRGDAFMGPPAMLEDSARWPGDVIVMTLGRVGSQAGPDLERLSAIAQRAPDSRIWAAGGVRHPSDLSALAKIGIEGVLVATALHSGALSRQDLQDL
ncbi:1-(5-phosphoribosyl)-5-[(5-phosphoribosylamino)methylideneamino] imidazole-4-carboxamide isomerase [Hartmannibacter diazotrophicus]|uniref:1-(5-phosphoribosyl)-5-[(5-phosphoribosylamino)methylideneamino] imidazole-4-carboxamide isomerase n=1 Tax=Hartmannibacter diazotrophicus TaxID=1482074 RepID=A0A2C9D6C5_9HYPH|nr:HisA/HisF-related TIM barrel protein [Hartmannibacter diazotrophicus]SON55857.1 1-(5-phosphoribosyl)-5-[(5-phosphoribosylamino)methylideneamino] imidazole-4-carboxamide isomerase [Hartmannibacter diazotrophicus]